MHRGSPLSLSSESGAWETDPQRPVRKGRASSSSHRVQRFGDSGMLMEKRGPRDPKPDHAIAPHYMVQEKGCSLHQILKWSPFSS